MKTHRQRVDKLRKNIVRTAAKQMYTLLLILHFSIAALMVLSQMLSYSNTSSLIIIKIGVAIIFGVAMVINAIVFSHLKDLKK